MKPKYRPYACIALLASLSACGGGGGGGDVSSRADAGTGQSDATCFISDFSQQMLNALNTVRASAHSCGATPFGPAGPLAWSGALTASSAGHSNDMATHNFFSHTGSNGSSAGERIAAANGSKKGYGETLAAGSKDAAATVAALMDSPPHCEILMGQRFTQVGAACVKNPATTYKTYWTLNFGV
jgi:uncharacterized protein YkwD